MGFHRCLLLFEQFANQFAIARFFFFAVDGYRVAGDDSDGFTYVSACVSERIDESTVMSIVMIEATLVG